MQLCIRKNQALILKDTLKRIEILMGQLKEFGALAGINNKHKMKMLIKTQK